MLTRATAAAAAAAAAAAVVALVAVFGAAPTALAGGPGGGVACGDCICDVEADAPGQTLSSTGGHAGSEPQDGSGSGPSDPWTCVYELLSPQPPSVPGPGRTPWRAAGRPPDSPVRAPDGQHARRRVPERSGVHPNATTVRWKRSPVIWHLTQPMLTAPTADRALPPGWVLPPGWAAGPKWDGCHAQLARYADGRVLLRSRRGADMTPSFPEIRSAAAQLPGDTGLDGVM